MGTSDNFYVTTLIDRQTGREVSIVDISTGTDGGDKVAITGSDTTPDFLGTKLVAGTDISLTVLNPGANETLAISSVGGDGNIYVNNGILTQNREVTQNGFTLGFTGGDFGIGIVDPLERLHIDGGNIRVDSTDNPAVIVSNTAFGGKAGALVGGTQLTSILYDNTGSFSIQARTSAQVIAGSPDSADAKFLIDPVGNVGIGIVPLEKLHVAGNGIIDGNLSVIGSITDVTNITTSGTVSAVNFSILGATSGKITLQSAASVTDYSIIFPALAPTTDNQLITIDTNGSLTYEPLLTFNAASALLDVNGSIRLIGSANRKIILGDGVLEVGSSGNSGVFNATGLVTLQVAGINKLVIVPTITRFNAPNLDVDFEVHTLDNANAFFIDGGTGNVSIGSGNAASVRLEVGGAIRTSGTIANFSSQIAFSTGGGRDSFITNVNSFSAIYHSIINTGSPPFDQIGSLIIQSRVATNRDIALVTGDPAAVRVLIEGGGRVGVGTITPLELLHTDGGNIRVDNTSNPAIIVNSTGTGKPGALVAGDSFSSILYDDTGSFSIQARTTAQVIAGFPSSSEVQFLIDGVGNVGIGTGSAAPGARLHINSSNTVETTSQMIIEADSGSGAETFATLEFQANATSAAVAPVGRIKAFAPTPGFTDAEMIFQTIGAGPSFVDTLFLKNGNVGIGIAPSTAKLEVAGNINIGIASGAIANEITFADNSLSNQISFATAGVSDPTGDTGWKLKLWDNPALATSYGLGIDSNALWLQTGGTRIEFWDSGSEVAVIENGNLGLGITAPTNKLEVDGFTKLGTDAPAIKTKKLTGTTPASEGSSTTITHGLTLSKIIGLNVLVTASNGNSIPPALTFVNEFEYYAFITSTDVEIRLSNTNSGNMLSKAIVVLLTHEA